VAPRGLLTRAVLAALLLFAGAARAATGWDEVAALYRQTLYDEARRAARRLEGSSPEALFWAIQLEADPRTALAALDRGVSRPDVPKELRARFAYEIALIQFSRARYAAVLAARDRGRAWGGRAGSPAATLLAARSLRALGRDDEARELLRRTGTRDEDPRVAVGSTPTVSAPAPAAPAAAAGGARGGDPARQVAAAAGAAYTLQLGAFADRTRAQAFIDEWRSRVSGLRLVEATGAGGMRLYKVQMGGWPDRSRADAEAARLRRELNLTPIVVIAPR